MLRLFRPSVLLTLLTAGLSLGASLHAADAPAPIVTPEVTYFPAAGTPYAGAARVSPYAAKLFLSGVAAADAPGALDGLQEALKLAGASPAHLFNVRASLLPDAAGSVPMDTWNAAWESLLADVGHRPTRTTLGTVALADPAQTVVAEGIAALPYDLAAPAPGAPTLNPYVRSLGSGLYGAAAATWVQPGTALIFTAGTLADPADPKQPENSVARYGDMATQTTSTLARLDATLATQGVSRADVFYVRALLSPTPGETTVDYAGFGAAFAAAFSGLHPAMRPALMMWAAPGFNSTGRLVEIEAYAAAPDPAGPFALASLTEAPASPRMTGTASSSISSSGAAGRYQTLTWFAGTIGPAGTMHDEGVNALLVLRSRAAAAGASLGRAVMLRAYPVVGDDFRGQFAEWNEAYGRFFNVAGLNPHKPARTAFPVTALPGGRRIEVEIVTVEP